MPAESKADRFVGPGSMKVGLVQFNPTVGAIGDNVEEMLAAARRALAHGAEVALYSELCICGYPPRDLLERPAFVAAVEAGAHDFLRRAPPELTLVFGTLGRAHSPGPPLYNEAWVARAGVLLGQARKQLLPSYDVFDEARYFKPGKETLLLEVCGRRTGFTICEDAWSDTDAVGSRYAGSPAADAAQGGAEVLFNLSASPFTLGKFEQRPQMFARIAREYGLATVVVNQVGANDELIFDGRSGAWDRDGRTLVALPGCQSAECVVDLTPGAGNERPKPPGLQLRGPGPVPEVKTVWALGAPAQRGGAEEALYDALVLGVSDYVRKCGFESVVLGLSGGIDSALTAAIAADAVGPSNVLALAMPTRYSSEGSVTDARALAENLGVRFEVTSIDPLFQAYQDALGPLLDRVRPAAEGDVSLENIQARVRGATLMAVSNRSGALVLTTGNKSELAVGYCTLYGDMVGGLGVIADLLKTRVYSLARFVNQRAREREPSRALRGGGLIPLATLDKPPSAELRPDQTDQDSLPPYDVLDAIVSAYVEEHLGVEAIVATGFEAALVQQVVGLIHRSEHKRFQAAPALIVTRKAFGLGRRLPRAQRFGG